MKRKTALGANKAKIGFKGVGYRRRSCLIETVWDLWAL